MIDIHKLSKSFDGHKVLDDVSFNIKKGTIHGIIGENGVGKTTLLQCLVGIYKPDEGSIEVEGESVWENVKVKEEIGYVADRNQFFKQASVKEMVDFFEMMYPKFSRSDFNTYNKVFQINPKSKVKQLSKGMQMRLSFMLNLASHPKVLVLDEPTSGLDAAIKKELLNFLIEEVSMNETTVVIASHHLGELEKLCDEVTMFKQGKIIYESSVADLKEKVRKLQVVFETEAPADLMSWPEFIAVEQIGNVYYVVTNDYTIQVEQKLKEHGAMRIATIGLTLEEIFIYTRGEEKDKDMKLAMA